MRNMRLSDLRKKKSSYFRNLGVVTSKGKKRSTIEYIVRRSYDALSQKLKDYIEDRDQITSVIVNTIMEGGELAQMKPYEALKKYAEYGRRRSGINTKSFIFKRFREEEPSLYAKYNSYMYRQGFSASKYFYENAELHQQGSVVICTVDLPPKSSGVVYETLYIEYDFSGQDFWAEMN